MDVKICNICGKKIADFSGVRIVAVFPIPFSKEYDAHISCFKNLIKEIEEKREQTSADVIDPDSRTRNIKKRIKRFKR